MLDYYYYAGFAAEFIAAISATVFLYKYKHTTIKWLLPVLWFIPINELVCQYIFLKMPAGYFLYNVYKIIVPLSIIAIIASQLQKRKNKLFTKAILAIAVVFYVVEIFKINLFKDFLDISFTAASIGILTALLVYFIEELNSTQTSIVHRNLFLLICFGFLIFHLPYPILIFVENDITQYSDEAVTAIYKIHLILVIVSYLMIALGFYWGEKVVQKPD